MNEALNPAPTQNSPDLLGDSNEAAPAAESLPAERTVPASFNVEEGVDPAIVALARVRSAAKKQQARPSNFGRFFRPRGRGGFSGPGPDARDPRRLGNAMDSWANDRGVQAELTVAGLTSRWEEIVGDHVARHVTADEYHRLPTGGRLVITADTPAWESTMKYQIDTIKRRIAEELGDGLVTVVEVRGLGRTRRKGWRVQTGRRR